MIKKFIFFFVFFTALSFRSSGLTTWIEGKAPGFNGKSVRLSIYSDQLTYRLTLLGTALVESNGNFSMPVEVEDTIIAYLSVGFRKTSLILVPGQRYYCLIEVNADSLKQQKLPAVSQSLPLIIENLAEDDINRQVSRFNTDYEEFLAKNAKALLSARKKILVDSLERSISKTFHPKSASFFDHYITYRLAGMKGLVNRWSVETSFRKYLKDKTILYDHPVYMEYFNEFFDHYLTRKSPYIKSRDLEATINQSGDLLALTDSLGKDSLLRNERLRELVLLKNLGGLYHEPAFNSRNVMEMIRQIGEKSKFPVHRVIATNLLFQLTRLKPGTAAPEFTLTDQGGKDRSLNAFRGKWVYLGFFTTWCDNCQAELKVIQPLKQKFDEKVEFISVCCDEDPLALGNLINSNKQYDWTFVNIEDSMETLEAYDVFSFPLYVLIDPEGNISRYPANRPSDHAGEILDAVLK